MRWPAALVLVALAGALAVLVLLDTGPHEGPVASPTQTPGMPGVLDSPLLAPGQDYSFTFGEAGTVHYECHPHPWMTGRIDVMPNDGQPPRTWNVTILEEGDWRFEPALLQVKAGDTVRWHNAGSEPHTATDVRSHVH